MWAEQPIVLQKNSHGALLYHTASKFGSQISDEKYCLLSFKKRTWSSRQDSILLMSVGRDFSEIFGKGWCL